MTCEPPAAAKRVLFVCVENACRSQMAEAFVRMHSAGYLDVYSAGSQPAGRVHSQAITVMYERDYDLNAHRAKSLLEIPAEEYDVVVTMGCGDACPTVRTKRWSM